MKNKALTLSIVIPVYNEERHLKACLNSIAAQTTGPVEAVVVDNNSTDKSIKIARSYSFVRVITQKQQCKHFARTAGFNAVKNDLIGRIDADTILPPNWVEGVLDFYAEPTNRQLALTGGCYFYNVRLPRFWGWMQGQIAFRMNRLLLGHYITYGSNMVLPRVVWQKIAPKTCRRDDIHEDLDISIHMHQAGFDTVYQESLRVGVKMRRVRSEHQELWANLMLWPQTLRVHHMNTWVFGWLGAVLVYAVSPIGPIQEWIARRLGCPPLSE